MIHLEDIRIAFDEVVAVPQLNLSVAEGQFFTLLGPSGCGKTTVLRALAGLTQPDSGRIRVDGADVTRLPPDKRGIGMVFQNYALFPTMSVFDNIAFGLTVQKVPKDEVRERVRAIAAEVDLTAKQLARSVAELSGGQQQRVAIARALISRPKILLLDEPLSNLDAKLRQQLRVQLKDMQRHFGITTVYVTHDQSEALTLSDRIAVMHRGRIEQVGAPRDIYSRSQTEFVCTFIGEANRLPVAHLREQGFVPTGASAYTRIERVKLLPADIPVPAGHVRFAATVREQRYEGPTTTYIAEYGPDLRMQVIEKDRPDAELRPGDRVTLAIAHDDILQFADGADT